MSSLSFEVFLKFANMLCQYIKLDPDSDMIQHLRIHWRLLTFQKQTKNRMKSAFLICRTARILQDY